MNTTRCGEMSDAWSRLDTLARIGTLNRPRSKSWSQNILPAGSWSWYWNTMWSRGDLWSQSWSHDKQWATLRIW